MPIPWDAFLTRYSPMARAIARGLVQPPAVAEDIVQEAALAVFQAWQRDPTRFPEPAAARGYFLRATRNLALRSRRTRGREQPLGQLPVADREDGEAARVRERQALLARLLCDLEPEERAWIQGRFLERKSLAALARESGTPISTLHSRERALLARLRQRMDQEEQR